MPLKPGTILSDRYRIVRFINSGGFGCTYEAMHIEFEERVAIKEFFVRDFCNRDETTGEVTVGITERTQLVEKLKSKFKREAKFIRKLAHPNIIRVTDVFEENGTAYYAMDYIDGISLSQLVKERGPLPEAQALKYIRQIASALDYIHSKNLLHLDVKPGNIMLAPGDRAVLIDFGASKQYDSVNGENTSTLLGYTPGYAPPEQVSHDVSSLHEATDIYSLGATLYNLLSGIVPPDPNKRWDNPLQPLPGSVSAATSAAVFAALNPSLKGRPQSISAFLGILDGKTADDNTVVDTVPIQEPAPIPKPSPTPKPVPSPDPDPDPEPKKSKLPWVIGIACLLAIAAGVVYFLTRPGETNFVGENSEEVAENQEEVAENQEEVVENQEEVAENIEATIPLEPKEYNVNGVRFTMIPVEGGTFQMGSNDGYDDERPVHSVTLSSYYIGETEVTQELWEAVMGSNPSHYKGSRRPVEEVSYNDCKTFISRLNSITGQNFRLPTEAEWEFAARGGNSSRGYKYAGSDNIGSVAWYDGNSGTHEVKGKSPNELGLYDMSGNVYEWCNDWYDDYPSGSVTNPKGPGSGSYRVDRGGGWLSCADFCRSAYRYGDGPDNSDIYLGLRLAQ